MMDVEINPIYIIDEGRKSTSKELKAIGQITNIINTSDITKAIINPLKIVRLKEIEQNKEITESWRKLNLKDQLGTQYDFLARLANQLGYGKLELGVTFDPRGKIARTVIQSEITQRLWQNQTSAIYIRKLFI